MIKFEAKRLSSALPVIRAREYVIGEYKAGTQVKNSGGIERFKNGRHGRDISHACIIGYVQSDSFSSWLQKINAWITDEISNPSDAMLSWDNLDMLSTVTSSSRISSYKSTSKRSTGVALDLMHLWISFV